MREKKNRKRKVKSDELKILDLRVEIVLIPRTAAHQVRTINFVFNLNFSLVDLNILYTIRNAHVDSKLLTDYYWV